MLTFNVQQTKTHLSQILKLLAQGEQIVITRYGKPVAQIIPYAPQKAQRKFGALKGKAKLDDTFFDELPEEELSAWNS